jgi:hypothetical protein
MQHPRTHPGQGPRSHPGLLADQDRRHHAGRDRRRRRLHVHEPGLPAQHRHLCRHLPRSRARPGPGQGLPPLLYWTTIIATTTVGTTLADFADRSLGIGYAGGSGLLLALLAGSLLVWHRSLGSVSVSTVSSPRAEAFYWLTIMFSQTLGTALGDWTADTAGLGYTGAAVVFGALLLLVVAAYRWTGCRARCCSGPPSS